MMSSMRPKSENWSVEQLVKKIKDHSVSNPQCQRKKRWEKFPTKGKMKGNFYDYIKFLYETCYSVEAISIAEYITDDRKIYVNIDGNNRMNAIVYFYENPFEIFQQDNQEFIDNCQNEIFLNFMKSINYPTIVKIRTLDEFIAESTDDLVKSYWDGLNIEERRKVEREFRRLQGRLMLDSGEYFHTNVFMNLVIFNGPTAEQLAKIFSSINTYSNPLSKSDILAATLLTATNFDLSYDMVFSVKIREKVNEYYDDKVKDEILDSFTFRGNEEKRINGSEFLIGFQNYCHEKYGFVPKFDSDGFGVFHKLYDYDEIFYRLEKDNFTTENVRNFHIRCEKALEIFKNVFDRIFPKTIETQYFKKDYHMELKKNTLFLLISVCIKLQEISQEKQIIQLFKKILSFHFLINYLPDNLKDIYRQYDCLKYQHGGGAIFQTTTKFLENTHLFGEKITKEIFEEVLQHIINKYNLPCEIKDKPKNRRYLEFPYRFLISNYYYSNIPLKYSGISTGIHENVDHIIPKSSIWLEGILDIDRLGNMILMDGKMNKERNMQSIQYYYDNCKVIMRSLGYPKIEEYNKVVSHEKKGPIIIDVSAYDNLAKQMEEKYIRCAIKCIFD